MTENNDSSELTLDGILNYLFINEVIFTGLIILCFIGDIIGEVTASATMYYWLTMVPVFFFSSMLTEKARVYKTGIIDPNFLRFELIHWGSALVTILLVIFLWHADHLNPQSAGLVAHVVLAHTMFLSGTRLGFRFYLVGFFLFITAAFTIAMEGTVGIVLLTTLPIVILGLYLEDHYLFPVIKRTYALDEQDLTADSKK